MHRHAMIVALCFVATCFSTSALADAIAVPEPSSMSLFAVAAIGLVLIARTFKRASQNR